MLLAFLEMPFISPTPDTPRYRQIQEDTTRYKHILENARRYRNFLKSSKNLTRLALQELNSQIHAIAVVAESQS